MQVWKAHDLAVYAVAFSPCGQFLLSSAGDESVRLWDRDGREVRRWPGSMYAAPIAFSPCGRYVARGGYGVRVWAVDGGPDEPVVRALSYTDAVAFAPDGSVVLAHGNGDTPLARWALPDGKPMAGGWGGGRTDESFPTGPAVYAPDGRTVATLFGIHSKDRFHSVVTLREASTGNEMGRLWPDPATEHATHLAYSPDGTLLAGVYGPTLIVWDVVTQRTVARHKPTGKHFKGLAFTTDGRQLLTSSNDMTIRMWAAPTWGEATGYEWKVGRLGGVAVSPDGTLAAAGSTNGKIVVWDLDT